VIKNEPKLMKNGQNMTKSGIFYFSGWLILFTQFKAI